VRAKQAETGRTIGLYPELKHPTLLLEQDGIDSVDLLVRELQRYGLDKATSPVFVQVFEVRPLQRLNQLVDTPLILLISSEGGPYDEPGLRWTDLMTPTGLAAVAEYADGIGPFLGHVVTAEGKPTSLIADAHAAGLKVHPWTLRKENGFLPPAMQSPGGPDADGQWRKLFGAAIASGADGFFTDNVKELVELLRQP
jgi:glycerophosphoryl diester phosphodiesterase